MNAANEAERKPPHIFFAFPSYDLKAWTPWIECWEQTVLALHKAGIPYHREFLNGESLIPRGRNRLARMFLESECTHLMSIDLDLSGWNARHIVEMVNADVDVVGGIYPMKGFDMGRVAQAARFGLARGEQLFNAGALYVFNTTDAQFDDRPRGDIFECTRLGTGFLLCKRRVFETMLPKARSYKPDLAFDDHTKREHDFYTVGVHEKDDRYMSEDYGLCDFWREQCGGRVYGYLGVDLVHHGHFAFGGNVRQHFNEHRKKKR